jgi:cellulase/cellobiase CelA1
VTFAGDLLWNGMFPNFVDAKPSRLQASMKSLAARTGHSFVPGHGAMAGANSVSRYLDLLGDLDAAAKRGHDAGNTAVATAAAYTVPASLGEWMASKTGLERAMTAWYREWDAGK